MEISTYIKEEIVENDEKTDETCYFCGYKVQLEPGQSTVQCGLCSEILSFEPPNASGANAHISPNLDKPFKCEVCGKTSSLQCRLHGHSKRYTTPRLKCKYCCESFSKDSECTKPERRHLCRGKHGCFECDTCGIKFLSQELFELHNINTGHGSKPVKRICSPQHINDSSHCILEENGLYSCRFCGLTGQTEDDLVQHADEHRKHLPSKCFSCGLTFLELEDLKTHVCSPLNDLHPNTLRVRCKLASKTSEQKVASQKCASCGAIFPGLEQLLESHACPYLNEIRTCSQSNSNVLKEPIVCTPQGTSASKELLVENSTSLLLDRDVNASASESDTSRTACSPAHKISTQLRIRIKHLVSRGEFPKDVAKNLKVSEEVVNNIWRSLIINRDPDLAAYIVKQVSADRFLTLTQIDKIVQMDLNIYGRNVLNSTHRILHDYGYSLPERVPCLNQDILAQRLTWAEHHSEWSEEDWSRVLWSGTVKFRRFAASPPYKQVFFKRSRERVWRFRSEDPRERVIRSSSTGEDPLYIWACMSSRGFGKLSRIRGLLDSANYVTILRDSMLPSACALIGGHFILQHESNAKEVQDLDVQMCLGQINPALKMCLMEWPADGADLNPLETVWKKLCPILDGFESDNLDELFKKIESIIRQIETPLCRNLICKMKSRCAAVVKAKGMHIPVNCW